MAIQHSYSPLVRSHRPLRTVLIGTLLGEDSDDLVRAGLEVARAAGARVHLVHAAEVQLQHVGFDIGSGPVVDHDQIVQLTGELNRQVQRLGIQPQELDGAEVRVGSPHRILTQVASQIGADLIVVGATGFGPFAAELLGSTADRVLRQAVCPVLVVRGELRIPPRTVLAPVDLSTLSGDAFHCGLHLLGQIGGGETRVQAVYALSFLDALAARKRNGESVPLEQVEKAAGDELHRFVLENRPDVPVHVDCAVLSGDARAEILRTADEQPVDLVVLGSHGRSGLDRLMLGSVASTVARKAPCSVLVISPEAALSEGIAAAVESQTSPAWHGEPAGVSS
jgi:nucleotide-binding universal stress UspA family protein